MTDDPNLAGERLNALLAAAALDTLSPDRTSRFESYLSLFIRWNARVSLTAIRDEDGILTRHFVESIACARALPAGIATLLDFGSGAGFPGIPIALCRPEIAVTLAESQGKKAAFLREAVRQLGLAAHPDTETLDSMQGTGFSPYINAESAGTFQDAEKPVFVSGHDFSRAVSAAKQGRALAPEGRSSGASHEIPFVSAGCSVHSGRAEALTEHFDCVTLRAVDRMERAVQAAARLVRAGGWLALMTTGKELEKLKAAAGAEFAWAEPLQLPGSEDRLLALGARSRG
jgi:16S rRNA G527 N7-methylase RsmG